MFTVSLILSFLASILLIMAALFGILKDWKNQVMRYYAFFALSGFWNSFYDVSNLCLT